MQDNDTLEFLPRPATESSPTMGRPPSLVFVGFNVTWAKKIADLEVNVHFAEKWESHFSHWHVDERRVHLCCANRGYRINLEDGNANIAVFEPAEFLPQAREHLVDLLALLQSRMRERLTLETEVQYFRPVETADFESEMTVVSRRVIRRELVEALGATLADFAFYGDLWISGRLYTVSIGVLRASEVSVRVASARYLKSVPAVSRFHSVAAAEKIGKEFSVDDFLTDVFTVGHMMEQETDQ